MALTIMSSPKEEKMKEPSMHVPLAPKPQYGSARPPFGRGIKTIQYAHMGNKSVTTNWRPM